MEGHSIYIHVPFCRHRCAYCDFNTYAGQDKAIPAYVSALCREIRLVAESGSDLFDQKIPLHTIFFGGGTPSLFSSSQLEEILATISQCFDLHMDAEITLEANPGTTSMKYLSDLYAMGVNRLSMGMQSAIPGELKLIERQHSFEDVVQSVAWARRARFENVSLDLLFAIPGQTMESWNESLERALDLETEHLSLYSLTIEEGTPFYLWMKQGKIQPVEEDLAADMMEYAEDRLEQAGFDHYEISNWARKDAANRFECRHNLQYWRNKPYYGFGAGAHGCLNGFRLANARGIGEYVQLIESGDRKPYPFSPATVEHVTLDEVSAMQETMMVGLRLTREGVNSREFFTRFGRNLGDVFGKQIGKLIDQGLLEWFEEDSRLRLTHRGRFLGNRVFMEFVGDH